MHRIRDWTEFKKYLDRGLSPQEIADDDNEGQVRIILIDGTLQIYFRAYKGNETDDTSTEWTEYVSTYQVNANKTFTDANGIPLQRTKVTQSKWHYQLYGIEFTTAGLTSVVNTDTGGVDLAHCSLKVYDASDVEQTNQTDATANGVKTVLDWEPPWDYEIIGGGCRQHTYPTTNIYLNCVAVPDLPTVYGGSVPFFNNINMKYVQLGDKVEVNGRTAKKLIYDTTYHTNKLRFIVHHAVGTVHDIHVALELFRS